MAQRTERRSHTHLVRAPGAERQEDREKAVFEEIITTETFLEPMKTKIHIFGSSTSSKKHLKATADILIHFQRPDAKR